MEKLDLTALQEPVTPEDIEAFRQYKQGIGRAQNYTWLKWLALTIWAIFALRFMIAAPDAILIGILFFIVIPGAVFGLVWWASRLEERKQAKLYKFAMRNGLSFRTSVTNPGYQGIIFNAGHSRLLREAVVFPEGIEIGNYQYVTGSGKNQTTHNWAYVRLQLTRHLPHMILDAKGNNFWKFSNLNEAFDRSQTLSLEGDFDTYFTLYAPKQYERDALYVFTPDVMAAMIDYGKSYDIEVIDNQLFLYQNGSFQLDHPEFYQNIGKIISTIHTEMIDQTDYYADERVGDRTQDIVASRGARLKRGINWAIVLIFIIVIYLTFIQPIIISVLR